MEKKLIACKTKFNNYLKPNEIFFYYAHKRDVETKINVVFLFLNAPYERNQN